MPDFFGSNHCLGIHSRGNDPREKSMSHVNFLLQRGRLALQEFGPSMALLTLPGGYLVALTDWIFRRWPSGSKE